MSPLGGAFHTQPPVQDAAISLVRQSSCVCAVVMASAVTAESLANTAFAHEPGVCVVAANVSGWTGGGVVFRAPAPDFTCLVEPPVSGFAAAKPTDIAYDEDAVEIINGVCNTHRAADGTLTRRGRWVAALEARVAARRTTSTTSSPASCPVLHLDSNNNLTADRLKAIVARHWPVVLKRAGAAPPGPWTRERLVELIGNDTVHVKVTPDGAFEGCVLGDEWSGKPEGEHTADIPPSILAKMPHPDHVLLRPATADITVSEFLDPTSDLNARPNSVPYLEYFPASRLAAMDALIPEFPHAGALFPTNGSIHNVWLGQKPTVGVTHFDAYENLLTVLEGEKRVTLVHPYANHQMGEGHVREAFLQVGPDGEWVAEFADSTSRVNTPVDVKSAASAVTTMECVVEAGDTLFLPSFWWHQVDSTPSASTGLHLASNVWYAPLFTKPYPCPTCPYAVNPTWWDSVEDGLSSLDALCGGGNDVDTAPWCTKEDEDEEEKKEKKNK